MRLDKKIVKTTENLLEKLKNKTFSMFLLTSSISLFTFFYILLRLKFIDDKIPFWYTKLWGDWQLAPKHTLFLLPLISLAISLCGLLLVLLNKYYIRFYEEMVWLCVSFCNVFLFVSVFRIINISSVPFNPIINPLYISLLPAFVTSFLLIYLVMPSFIEFAQRKRLITNPQVHLHPGMILKSPSARGGGFVYAMVFLFTALIFVGIPRSFVGFYLSIIMTAFLGIVDDYQNTHPSSSYRLMENPVLRLFLLFTSVLPVVLSGVMIYSVSNPFGGYINLNILELHTRSGLLPIIPILVTAVWIVWLMNVLSWSNGVDGQFPGIVGIASIIVALLALRFKEIEPYHMQIAVLAAISAGAAFGSVRFNWHPSQVMWGFGAMSAGFVIASLAILAQAKITVSVLIILIPFLDALFTVIRRLAKGKSPFKGDRGHLHHILLDKGWSVSKVALFYWLATAVFGIIGLLSPERMVFKLAFIISGVVAFLLIILNTSLAIREKKNLDTQP